MYFEIRSREEEETNETCNLGILKSLLSWPYETTYNQGNPTALKPQWFVAQTNVHTGHHMEDQMKRINCYHRAPVTRGGIEGNR